MRPASFLLIDDDDLDAEAAERAIRAVQIEDPISRARDGEEALRMLSGAEGVIHVKTPVLILLDLNMPRMTGVEFLRKLRSHPDADIRRAVTFVYTTSNEEADRLAAYDEYAAGYIVKNDVDGRSVDLSSLIESYRNLVELP